MGLSKYIFLIKPIVYWEISKTEAIHFYQSLGAERRTNRLPLSDLLNSELLLGEKKDNQVVGLIGITRVKCFPMLFIFVKSEYQNNKIGNLLMKRMEDLCESRYFIVVLKVMKSNEIAIKLYLSHDYNIFYEDYLNYYMAKTSLLCLRLLSIVSKSFFTLGSLFSNLKKINNKS